MSGVTTSTDGGPPRIAMWVKSFMMSTGGFGVVALMMMKPPMPETMRL